MKYFNDMAQTSHLGFISKQEHYEQKITSGHKTLQPSECAVLKEVQNGHFLKF